MENNWLDHYRDAGNRSDQEGMSGRPNDLTPLINRIVLEAVIIGPGDVVVDFGCGDGSLLKLMNGCKRRIGIAPSKEEVSALRQMHATEDVEFIEAMAPNIPLPNCIATHFVSNGVFLLLPSEAIVIGLLREMRRVLRLGGMAYIGEVPVEVSEARRLLRRPLELMQTHGLYELCRRSLRFSIGGLSASSGQKSPQNQGAQKYWTSNPEHFRTIAQECGFRVERTSRHELKLDGKWVEYPRNRFNYILRAVEYPT